MNTRYRYTKKELAKDLDMTTKRLTIELKILETDTEFIAKFPNYSRNCQILHPQIYKYILAQIGDYEPEDIKKITARNFLENLK